MISPGLYIGIDAGGSKSELAACLYPEGEPILLAGGPANLKRSGIQAASDVISRLIQEVLVSFPDQPIISICTGAAGAHIETDCNNLAHLLRTRFVRFQPAVSVVNDGVIALDAALEDRSGMILIAGTGSLVLGRTPDRRIVRAGGWGYLLGDEGSGFAIGQAGLRAIVSAADGGQQTTLSRYLAEEHQITSTDRLVEMVYLQGWPIQQFARSVLNAARAHDPVAVHLLTEETGKLARQVQLLLKREPDLGRSLFLFGGLSHDPVYTETLMEHLLRFDPDLAVAPASKKPAEGALYRAIHHPGAP